MSSVCGQTCPSLPAVRPQQYDTVTHWYPNKHALLCFSLQHHQHAATFFLLSCCCDLSSSVCKARHCSFLPLLSLSCRPSLSSALHSLTLHSFFLLWNWHGLTFRCFFFLCIFWGALYSFISCFPFLAHFLWYLYALLFPCLSFSSLCLCVLLSFFPAVSCDRSDHQAVSFDPCQDGPVCLSHSFQPCPPDLHFFLFFLLLLLSCTPPSEITLITLSLSYFSIVCLTFSSFSFPSREKAPLTVLKCIIGLKKIHSKMTEDNRKVSCQLTCTDGAQVFNHPEHLQSCREM